MQNQKKMKYNEQVNAKVVKTWVKIMLITTCNTKTAIAKILITERMLLFFSLFN